MASVRVCVPILAVVRPLGSLLCFALVLGLGFDTSASDQLQPHELKPVYWQQRLFFIPYRVNKRDVLAKQAAKVQLLISRNGANDWRPLQEATPNVQGFAYHAPEDGEYWFALRHLDRQGKPWPSTAIQPLIRIAVDTALPELQLSGSLGSAGTLVVRYESRDANLRPESLVIEARMAGKTWSNVQLGPPDVSQPDHLVGRAQWAIPFGATTIEIRASIADQAGHRAQTSTDVVVTGPSLQMPAAPSNRATPQLRQSAEQPSGRADPFQSAAKLPSRDWPANNRIPRPESRSSASLSATENPPLRSPYTVGKKPGRLSRTPARLVADGIANMSDPLFNSPPAGEDDWAAPSSSSQATAIRTVNSRTFDVEYDLQSVGPWGVSRVELWGTHDGGRTWQSYGVDSDNRSPVRANVSGAGVYGFRILVDGANGVRATPPRPGDQPELLVAVDLQPPAAEILSAKLGEGNLAGHLLLTWSVEDTNLEPRPIGLFYSAFPNGPWSTIAAGLENTGSYTWRLERHVPDRFFVRLEARDIAGNLATYQLPEPIVLARPQPTGHLRGVRPVK